MVLMYYWVTLAHEIEYGQCVDAEISAEARNFYLSKQWDNWNSSTWNENINHIFNCCDGENNIHCDYDCGGVVIE